MSCSFHVAYVNTALAPGAAADRVVHLDLILVVKSDWDQISLQDKIMKRWHFISQRSKVGSGATFQHVIKLLIVVVSVTKQLLQSD